jgi:hypothetical protein
MAVVDLIGKPLLSLIHEQSMYHRVHERARVERR